MCDGDQKWKNLVTCDSVSEVKSYLLVSSTKCDILLQDFLLKNAWSWIQPYLRHMEMEIPFCTEMGNWAHTKQASTVDLQGESCQWLHPLESVKAISEQHKTFELHGMVTCFWQLFWPQSCFPGCPLSWRGQQCCCYNIQRLINAYAVIETKMVYFYSFV